MKLNKRTIIIVLIVAVVAWFIWKKMKAATATANDSTPNVSGVDLDSVDSIIEAIGATSSEKTYIKRIEQKIADSPTWQASVATNAENNGLTYAQQVVCDAYWLLYADTENSVWKDDRGWKQTKKVKEL